MSSPIASRQQGRSARKRAMRRITATATAQKGEPNCPVEPPPELSAEDAAAEMGCLLSRVQLAILQRYSNALRRLSTVLDTETTENFLIQHLAEARKWGLEGILRTMVFDAAGNFADSRMLKLTRKYQPR